MTAPKAGSLTGTRRPYLRNFEVDDDHKVPKDYDDLDPERAGKVRVYFTSSPAGVAPDPEMCVRGSELPIPVFFIYLRSV